MLAIITKMTLTQVSTWFANARRRLKKDNKMTWSPRNSGSEGGKEDYDSEDCEGNDDDDDVEGLGMDLEGSLGGPRKFIIILYFNQKLTVGLLIIFSGDGISFEIFNKRSLSSRFMHCNSV